MKWKFEPGHSAAEFRARHMMVTWVRGSFKNVEGALDFDPDHPEALAVEANIDATMCWSGEPMRDEHLRSADFLYCEKYPSIRYASTGAVQIGPVDFEVLGNLTIRAVTLPVTLSVRYLGTWQTPWWEDGVDKGPKARVGFTGKASIDRYDFGVNWNGDLPDGGIIVSRRIDIVLDVEGIRVDT
ncbi:MAG TPA: YceI family protein [Candidatus Dormibacteraeota bacterium]|nr:YceI family protein [Candidatus Dormibacteraeota bacterium]